MSNLEKTNRVNRLLDFYGELLKEKSREYISQYYSEDLSLAEISENAGVSRQAVLENVQRTEKQLESYEAVLHLISTAEKRNQFLQQLEKMITTDNEEGQKLIHQIQQLDD